MSEGVDAAAPLAGRAVHRHAQRFPAHRGALISPNVRCNFLPRFQPLGVRRQEGIEPLVKH